MNKRGVSTAVMIAFLVFSVSCQKTASSGRKQAPSLVQYATGMKAWLADDPHFPLALHENGRGYRSTLSSMEPPPEMRLAHDILLSSYSTLVFASEAKDRLEERDQRAAEAAGNDEVPQCLSGEERGQGYKITSNSTELEDACLVKDAAFNAYVAAEFNWGLAMANDCGTAPSLASYVVDDCLAR